MRPNIASRELRADWRNLFERAFGNPFQPVRLYHGRAVDRRLAHSGALALTTAPNAVLVSTAFHDAPEALQTLIIGHELAHAIQLSRPGDDAGTHLEAEAWRAAALALAGRRVQIRGRASQPLAAHGLFRYNDAYSYFGNFPRHLDLPISQRDRIQPFHFERLMDLILGSGQQDFVIESHANEPDPGDPQDLRGLHMPWRGRVRGQASTGEKVTRANIIKLTRMRNVHRQMQQAGDDITRWTHLLESIDLEMPASTVSWSGRIGQPGSGDAEDDARRIEASRELARNWLIQEGEGIDLNEEQTTRYVEKATQIYDKGIRKISFVGCNIGNDMDTLTAMRQFFNAQRFGAPRVQAGYGNVVVGLGARAVQSLIRDRNPRVYGRRGRRFAIEITNRGRATFAAADNREAIREWKSAHLMAGGGPRAGHQRFWLHWLQTAPAAFNRDAAYRQNYRYSSELWFTDIPR